MACPVARYGVGVGVLVLWMVHPTKACTNIFTQHACLCTHVFHPNPPPIPSETQVRLSGKVSSQYLTALLMAAPLCKDEAGVEIIIKDELVSQPYVSMTVKLMERFGVKVQLLDGLQHIRVPGQQQYKSPGEAYVEGDASSASYFLAGATITGGTVTVEGCGSDSLQGDVRFAEVMGLMGAKVEWAPYSITITGPPRGELRGIDHDCNDIPDAAMTLAVAAMFAEGQTAIRNVYNWRVKETERMKVRVFFFKGVTYEDDCVVMEVYILYQPQQEATHCVYPMLYRPL